MLTREKIIKTAEEVSPMFGRVGGFVSTDGEWCRCTTPAKFKVYLEKLGFVVTACYATDFSTGLQRPLRVTARLRLNVGTLAEPPTEISKTSAVMSAYETY